MGDSRIVAIDTEGTAENPWCLSFSTAPGEGYVIRANDAEGLGYFREWLFRGDRTIVFHNALWDIAVLRSMCIDIIEAGVPFTDTQVAAYLCGEPQSLKSMAFRFAGAEQPSFSDLVAEPAQEVARVWLTDLAGSRFPRNLGPKPDDREKALRLIERMLAKDDAKTGLRKRWASGRAREILQDELMLVGDMPEPTLDMIPLDTAVRYAGRDTDLTARIAPVLGAQIDALGLRPCLELDLSIIPMVERMQHVGMGVDLPYLRELGSLLDHEYATTCAMIEARAGRAVNPASGDRVAEWLFDDLGLPWKKKTKGGRPETGKRTLEAMSKDYSLSPEHRASIGLIIEARGIQKDKSFCDSAQEYTKADGRLHPRLLLTRTGTGRTAAKNPNILAFPKHSTRGKLVRGGFVAQEGRVLSEWDLSQIDLRALAFDSGDERMIAQFHSGHDFHTAGAADRFKKSPEAVTKDERFRQKKVNFAIPMGTTEHGLCDSFHQDGQTQQTVGQCAQLLKAWHEQYPQASAYIDGKHAQARRHGYVTNWMGRMRYLEGVQSSDKFARREAERQAQATPIQGGARDVVKLWIAEIWTRIVELRRQGYWVEAVLDVHDSVLFEHDVDAYEPLRAAVEDALAAIQIFSVPITCEGATGERWSDL